MSAMALRAGGTVEVSRTRRSGPRLEKDIYLAMAATTPEDLFGTPGWGVMSMTMSTAIQPSHPARFSAPVLAVIAPIVEQEAQHLGRPMRDVVPNIVEVRRWSPA